ncbi:hypothetical protein HYZ41_01545 [archaeon]|nr:hypothetical protein [archaeon]
MIVVKCDDERFAVHPKTFYQMRVNMLECNDKHQDVDYGSLKELAASGRIKASTEKCSVYYDLDTMEKIEAKGFVKRIEPKKMPKYN